MEDAQGWEQETREYDILRAFEQITIEIPSLQKDLLKLYKLQDAVTTNLSQNSGM